jgi:membrane protease YdiL (CAAX protease family)
MIIVVLLTTPLQCAGEEYGLRGLINRLFGSYWSSRVSFWVGGVVSSLLFAYLHSAQDIFLNIFYFSFGLLSCWMAWRSGGLEAGIAMHVVNNMFAMAVLPFSDISGMMNRQAGSASAWDVLPLAAVMLVSMGLVEWQVRRRKPVAVAAPGASSVEDGQFVGAAVPQRQVSV